MKRRTFVWLSAVGTATLGIPSLHCADPKNLLHKALAQPKLLSHLCGIKAVREIGENYLRIKPAESNKEKLIDLLLEETPGKEISRTAESSIIHAFLEKKIRDDFNVGRTLILKGWVLSETESRQCALFSLI